MAIDRRLLEYALKGLEAERDRIAYEIEELHAQLGGKIARARRRRATKAIKREITETATRAKKAVKKKASAAKKKARKMSAARRKALSEAMKKAWARRKGQAKA